MGSWEKGKWGKIILSVKFTWRIWIFKSLHTSTWWNFKKHFSNFAQQIQISSYSMYHEEDIYLQNNIKYFSQFKMEKHWMGSIIQRRWDLLHQMFWLFFSTREPDRDKLCNDRWIILKISEDLTGLTEITDGCSGLMKWLMKIKDKLNLLNGDRGCIIKMKSM